MNQKNNKPKRKVSVREPGLVINAPQARTEISPSVSLFAEVKKQIEAEQSNPIQSNPIPSHPIQSNVTPSKQTLASEETFRQPVSPVKDFQKVPNSIIREALPQKLFVGTSKHTYDVLYLKTRGAINPTRKIKATKRELIVLTGVSDVTIFKHIKNLQSVGLIKVEHRLGAADGSIYEVFIPEEIFDPSNPIQSNLTQSNTTQPDPTESNKVGLDPSKEVGLDWMGNIIENKRDADEPKTLLKTKTETDDEAFTEMNSILRDGCIRICGIKPSARDAINWTELGKFLILELEIAAAKTSGVSNAPAFLTEILRRRFFAARSGQGTTSKTKKAFDAIGKPESPNYEIKPLNESERAEAVEQLGEFAGETFLNDFKKWYTNDDWQWIIEKLNSQPK